MRITTSGRLALLLCVGLGFSGAGLASPAKADSVLLASPDEQRAFAKRSRTEAADTEKTLSRLLAKRTSANAAKVDGCVQTRLRAAQSLSGATKNSQHALEQALADQDIDRARHELRKTVVALSRSQKLLADAKRCLQAGGIDFVEVEMAGEAAGTSARSPDDTLPPLDVGPVFQPPISPYR